MVDNQFAEFRNEYMYGVLSEDILPVERIHLFHLWFDEARSAGESEPTAMSLATASKEGRPSVRIVLLKDANQDGFGFFTNFDSRKGEELLENPNAALLFFWPKTQRQVRIEGLVVRMAEEESDAYFLSRPLGSRIGAIISPQSKVIPSRVYLEERYKSEEATYSSGREPDRPHFWGGFRLVPTQIEFWQGRENRLHDRVVYRSLSPQGWEVLRLAP